MSLFSLGVLGEFIPHCNSQIPSPRFSQLLPPTRDTEAVPSTSLTLGQLDSLDCEDIEGQSTGMSFPDAIKFPKTGLLQFSITRQEVLILSNVLGRIPQAFITGKEGDLNQFMALTVVENISPTTMIATSSQEEMSAQSATEVFLRETEHGPREARGKPRRPKCSWTGSIFKRHPVLKFSATGPFGHDSLAL